MKYCDPSVRVSETSFIHFKVYPMTCSGKPFELAGKFVGTWKEYTVTPNGEKLGGTLHVSWDLDGCVVTQRYQAAEGDLAFLAFGYLDSENNSWQETYILSNGRVAHYRWREEGDTIVVDRIGGDPNNQRRLIIRNLTYEAYDVTEERSTDGGQTWDFVELTHTRREE